MRRPHPIRIAIFVATVLATVPAEAPASLGATQPQAVGWIE